MKRYKIIRAAFWLFSICVTSIALVYTQTGWKTIVITDLTREHFFRLDPVFVFMPAWLSLQVSGNFEGKVRIHYGDSLPGAAEEIEAKGKFFKELYHNEWYSNCVLKYEPLEIMQKSQKTGRIVVRYKFDDVFWDSIRI